MAICTSLAKTRWLKINGLARIRHGTTLFSLSGCKDDCSKADKEKKGPGSDVQGPGRGKGLTDQFNGGAKGNGTLDAHSVRSARMGSTAAARRAGISDASRAANARRNVASASISGS
jgi:hypothetical protein